MPLLPRAHECLVHARKARDYLLNGAHPDGQSKARFFFSQGFRQKRWPELRRALTAHGVLNPAECVRRHGAFSYWRVLGPLETPSGKRPLVWSIWEVEDDGVPRLVSAYPRRRP